MRLRQGLLELLRAVFSAPGSPFAADKFVSGEGAAVGGRCAPASGAFSLVLPAVPAHRGAAARPDALTSSRLAIFLGHLRFPLPPADFYVRFHFVQFLKLYHNPQRDHQALFLCRQHMDVLLVLAANKSPHIRHRFHQLSGGAQA